MKKSSLVVASIVALAGCTSVTGLRDLPEGVTIRPIAPVFTVFRENGLRRAEITAELANNSGVTIYYTPCSQVLQKEQGGRWVDVWQPVCPLALWLPDPVKPGETRQIQLSIFEYANQPGLPFPFDDSNAIFRIRIGLAIAADPPGNEEAYRNIDAEAAVSDSFKVTTEL